MALNSKTVLITGAGTGIGAAVAQHLASLGANVVLTGRTEKTLHETQARIAAATPGAKTLVVVADSSNAEHWPRVVSSTVAQFGGIDVLFNNAGTEGPHDQNPINASVADIQNIWNVNVVGPLLGVKFAGAEVLKRKGVIINTSSIASVFSRTSGPMVALYSPTKTAVDALTRQFHALYSPQGVRAYSVNPMVYESEMVGRSVTNPVMAAMGLGDSAKLGWAFNPIGVLGKAIDIAVVVASLISGATKYASGDNVVVAPGLTPGHPHTFDAGVLYAQMNSKEMFSTLVSYKTLPLSDLNGAPFAQDVEAKLRTTIVTHVDQAVAVMTAAAATASAAATAAAVAKK